jgi:hypothetical protein
MFLYICLTNYIIIYLTNIVIKCAIYRLFTNTIKNSATLHKAIKNQTNIL